MFGVVVRWQTSVQDVDFERRLLLRALLTALPPSVYTLPQACPTLDDLDLASVKVQPLLEALTVRRRIDLGDTEFCWDGAQAMAGLAPPPGPWGGADGGTPAFGGLSKQQLELAAFESLLLAFGASRALQVELEAAAAEEEHAALVRGVAARLGISGRQHRQILAALRRAEEPGETAAQRCSLPYRLRMLRDNLPADFDSDLAFFEWQERQAALIGCALHARLWAFDASSSVPDQNPTAGMGARVDALFTELLSIARPAPYTRTLELRRSQGFALGPYGACLQRIDKLYLDVLQLTRPEADRSDTSEDRATEAKAEEAAEVAEVAVEVAVEVAADGTAAAAECGDGAEGDGVGGAKGGGACEASPAVAVALPPPLSTHLYMSLLSCRFDAEKPASAAWGAVSTCRLLREALQSGQSARGLQKLTRPPAAPQASPLAQGCPLGPSPRGCQAVAVRPGA